MKTIKAIFDFVDDLDVLLMFFVTASIDTINRISPYLAFVVMVSTIIYGIVKTYSIIKKQRQKAMTKLIKHVTIR